MSASNQRIDVYLGVWKRRVQCLYTTTHDGVWECPFTYSIEYGTYKDIQLCNVEINRIDTPVTDVCDGLES